MTMQKGDYQRTSQALRQTRDATLARLQGDDRAEVRDIVRESYRATAVAIARYFYAVNKRFVWPKFLQDALGLDEVPAAREAFERMNIRDGGE